MIASDNMNSSERILTKAADYLRRQEGIVIKKKNGKEIAIYPAEFLNEQMKGKYTIEKSSIVNDLARYAGLLPTLISVPMNLASEDWPVFEEELLKKELKKLGKEILETARASMPVEGSENNTIISFRDKSDGKTHIALIINENILNDKQAPMVRVHSSCFTGDFLGSLRCDCGNQLKLAIEAIKNDGGGILIYLNQEGRGIGITNKIRAYKLQECGMDTYEANNTLGFADDERDFNIAVLILKHLGFDKIKLLSNNPRKVTELRKYGITISKRIPIVTKTGKHNERYMKAKKEKAGHML
ncbi:MAG: GTP cyclohydrolase II [Rickettsiales bacterium]